MSISHTIAKSLITTIVYYHTDVIKYMQTDDCVQYCTKVT